MKIIEVKNLTKKYKNNSFYSLKDVNFSVNKGDIVGLIGKNGAGKSTLLKLLAKSQRPSSGTVFYKNENIYKRENVLDSFGIMIEPVFFDYLTVEDNLKTFLKIHNGEKHLNQIEQILKLVDLWKSKDRKPATFSFGMKQRTALALALITEPDFIILDEPFVGLDPIGVKNLIDILKRWSDKKQTSMIISSHQLGELESICNRYIFIDSGKLREDIDEKKRKILINLRPHDEVEQNIVVDLAHKYKLFSGDNYLEIPIEIGKKELNLILEKLSKERLIVGISQSKENLESLFLEDN